MKTAIYHIRTRCNYSQSMAARELGVSRQMFSAWEHGDKPIPDIRKQSISALFGVPVSILEETDEAAVLSFCDRPMFSTTCQGKQVFSFLPPKKQTRVFLGVPTATRPEEQCKILMSQKAALLEKLDRLFQFDPQRQVDELPDMEWKLSVLSRFASVADAAEAVAPPYRGGCSGLFWSRWRFYRPCCREHSSRSRIPGHSSNCFCCAIAGDRSTRFLTTPAPMRRPQQKLQAGRNPSAHRLLVSESEKAGGGLDGTAMAAESNSGTGE